MHPVVPILACYALGLALLAARGRARDPLIASALAFPLGLAATSLVAFAVALVGLTPFRLGIAWLALVAACALSARREWRRLWPTAAVVAAGLAAIALVGSRLDLAVLGRGAHDTLLAARVLSADGGPPAAGLGTALHAAFFLIAPVHIAALALALAAAALFALAVLVRRAAGDRRAAAWLAIAALVTSFPFLRSLLTVGSPTAAGLLLLTAGAVLEGDAVDRRGLPLALIALAALALDGPTSAAAAALALAGLLLGGGLRHAIAAALVLVCFAITGEVVRGALVAAPLALEAAVGLAIAQRRPAPPPRWPVTRGDLAELAAVWLTATAILAGLEWLLLLTRAGDQLSGALQAARLLPLDVGNLLPYALAAALVFTAADVAARALTGRFRWPRLAVTAAAGLVAIPYAVWLGSYTFSGPQAQVMSMRPLLVAAVAAVVAVGLAAAVGMALVRRSRRRWPLAVAAALSLLVAGLLWLNHAGLENEYRPLHAFLALWAVLLAALAGRELAAHLAPRIERRPRRIAALTAAAVAWTACAGFLLARAHGDAWILWGETGATRYLTRRWTFLTRVPDRPADLPRTVARPDLESERAAALRAARAAAPPPNIVIFTIDSLRRDRVGAYGYTRHRVTPNIDRFAARGVRFTSAFTSFPATQVFNSALLLGRYMVFSAHQQPAGYRAEAITTLLDGRGYHMFVKSWFDPSSKNRFDPRPFKIDTYVAKDVHRVGMEEPLDEAMARLEAHLDQARARGEPALVWIHLLGAHLKGTRFVPDPAFDFGDSPMDLYESAIAGMDRWLGAVEERVTARLDPARPTVWIISADHGTNPTTRSRDLFNPIVRVPLVIVAPGAAPGRVDDHPVDVSLDVAATVVDLAGIRPPERYDGVSLVPLLAGLPADALDDRLILSNIGEWSGAIAGRYKYMRRADVESLFDWVADPGETHNLIGERYDLAYWLADAARRELDRRTRDAERAAGEEP